MLFRPPSLARRHSNLRRQFDTERSASYKQPNRPETKRADKEFENRKCAYISDVNVSLSSPASKQLRLGWLAECCKATSIKWLLSPARPSFPRPALMPPWKGYKSSQPPVRRDRAGTTIAREPARPGRAFSSGITEESAVRCCREEPSSSRMLANLNACATPTRRPFVCTVAAASANHLPAAASL